ncbi:malonyl-ACP O-methyltransferase BioC [Methylomonas sp. AM2-LC]|uniref:malonyl-ACP O-methyltransferase BioC n=1 Tax=Methylomonas sp. AM2-LC TaxID=3153301 RepID=UPI003266585E
MKPECLLDKGKIKQAFTEAAQSYDAFAGLQRQVGDTLLQKYPMQAQSGLVMDLGCGTGYLTRKMAEHSAQHALLAVDIALPMLQTCRQKNIISPVAYVCADAENLSFSAQSIQQIYSNLAVQWCQNLGAVFANCQRMLKPDGQWVFSTFGPTTLQELKTAWAAVDDYAHVNSFYTSTQIVEFLQESGFVSIEYECISYQSLYPSVLALMQELKAIGAHNVSSGRNRKLTSRSHLQQMIANYERAMSTGALLATYEIIFVRARV